MTVHKAANDHYAASVDDKILLKIGPGEWTPTAAGVQLAGQEPRLALSGFQFDVYEAA